MGSTPPERGSVFHNLFVHATPSVPEEARVIRDFRPFKFVHFCGLGQALGQNPGRRALFCPDRLRRTRNSGGALRCRVILRKKSRAMAERRLRCGIGVAHGGQCSPWPTGRPTSAQRLPSTRVNYHDERRQRRSQARGPIRADGLFLAACGWCNWSCLRVFAAGAVYFSALTAGALQHVGDPAPVRRGSPVHFFLKQRQSPRTASPAPR
jgi:hypothetical protein